MEGYWQEHQTWIGGHIGAGISRRIGGHIRWGSAGSQQWGIDRHIRCETASTLDGDQQVNQRTHQAWIGGHIKHGLAGTSSRDGRAHQAVISGHTSGRELAGTKWIDRHIRRRSAGGFGGQTRRGSAGTSSRDWRAHQAEIGGHIRIRLQLPLFFRRVIG